MEGAISMLTPEKRRKLLREIINAANRQDVHLLQEKLIELDPIEVVMSSHVLNLSYIRLLLTDKEKQC